MYVFCHQNARNLFSLCKLKIKTQPTLKWIVGFSGALLSIESHMLKISRILNLKIAYKEKYLNSSHYHAMTNIAIIFHMCKKSILDVWVYWNLTAFIFSCNLSHNSKRNFTVSQVLSDQQSASEIIYVEHTL